MCFPFKPLDSEGIGIELLVYLKYTKEYVINLNFQFKLKWINLNIYISFLFIGNQGSINSLPKLVSCRVKVITLCNWKLIIIYLRLD